LERNAEALERDKTMEEFIPTSIFFVLCIYILPKYVAV